MLWRIDMDTSTAEAGRVERLKMFQLICLGRAGSLSLILDEREGNQFSAYVNYLDFRQRAQGNTKQVKHFHEWRSQSLKN